MVPWRRRVAREAMEAVRESVARELVVEEEGAGFLRLGGERWISAAAGKAPLGRGGVRG